MFEILQQNEQNHDRGVAFPDGRRASWGDLISASKKRARNTPDGRVGLLMPTGRELVETLLAVWWRGGVPSCLPLPNRLGPRPRALERMQERCQHVLTAAPEEGEPLARDGRPGDGRELALMQFSSGTTLWPRPVMLSASNLLSNVRAILGRMPQPLDEQCCVSWLPLYHDMGLIGVLLSGLVSGQNLVLMRPEQFALRPVRWLETLARTGASISTASNFALELTVQRTRPDQIQRLDLSRLRCLAVGGETVQAATLQRFARHLAPAGFAFEALTPVYGLAEATLAVTMSAWDEPPRVHQGHVSVGRPVPGMDVRLEAGRILVRGPSVMQGYLDEEPPGEWLDTGDLGYLDGGELFVTGRAKDVLILNGRNHEPEPIEAAAGFRAVAASVRREDQSTEVLLVLVELEGDDPAAFASQVRSSVVRDTGLVPRQVHVVAPGDLPRTTSGKLRRAEAVRQVECGELAPLFTA